MKTIALTELAGLALVAAMGATGFAEVPVMRDAATHEELVLALRKAEQKDPMKHLPVAKSADATVPKQPQSLLGESDIISFGGLATLVPKRAIIQIPKSCTERLKLEPGAKLVSWADFYALNRGWITTVEIALVQAEGKLPLAEDTRKQMTKSRNLVVATYQGGPISMLPPKPTAKPTAKPTTESVSQPP
jgi:hypothetical protein